MIFSKAVLARFPGLLKLMDMVYSVRNVFYRTSSNVTTRTDLVKFLRDQLGDLELKRLVQDWKREYNLSLLTLDELALKVLSVVHDRAVYVGDLENWRLTERWQTVSESVKTWRGDCEDMAVLLFCVLRLCGVPALRVRLVCGDVEYDGVVGGHAYVVYVAENGEEYVLDWCWMYDSVKIEYRLPWRDQSTYRGYWFMVNDERGYGEKNLRLLDKWQE